MVRMDFRICLAVVLALIRYSNQCKTEYDSVKCIYQMTCVSTIDTQYGWQSFRKESYTRSQWGFNVEFCSDGPSISYGGYVLDQVHLKMTESLVTREFESARQVPAMLYGNNGFTSVIYSIDLSDNEYYETPVLKSMQNLAILNISRNHITTAVLSNHNELNSLIEIDLSHNAINNINVDINEYPYRALKRIDLSHNYLVNIPDAVFDKFDDLERLDLGFNYIDTLSQSTFEGTRNLIHLDLSNNRLTDINSSLFRFAMLQVLKLSANRLSNIKLNDFTQLSKLENLDLSSNSLKTIDAISFANMGQLKILDLSSNKIEIANKDMFINMNSLINVNLSNNKLKSLPRGMFRNKTLYDFAISDNILEGSLIKGMFEGVNVTKLDLSNQMLTSVEDYAFNELIRLETLLLNSNQIQTLSNLCFKTLINLQVLDLSHNQISSFEFNKDDLSNLHSMLLKHNLLTQITHEQFQNLNGLEYLDLSENTITNLAPSSFKSLKGLINLQVSNNPLTGTLKTGTFDGLTSLPSLDISCNLLTTIQNASFSDMNDLKRLNMSFSNISELEFNVFVHTGYIETLDLSHNKLETFFINLTELVGLTTLLLNNNLIQTISTTSFIGLQNLNMLVLSHNNIKTVHNDSFNEQEDMRSLDLSYNDKLEFSFELLVKMKNLNRIDLSGITTGINFARITNTVTHVIISNASITNITEMNLNGLAQAVTLVLSNNNVSKLEIGAFSGMDSLRDLDLSYNKISYIQPGVFKNNSLLHSLNISHNDLSTIGYGIFRGLIYLNTLDMSYNKITDLQNERFYEVRSLSELIVDHNRIESVSIEEFEGTSLNKLSIGDNPLPCHILVKLKKNGPLEITAITIDEHSDENIDGVSCNKDRTTLTTVLPSKVPTLSVNNDVLFDIRNILYNLSIKHNEMTQANATKNLEDIIHAIENTNKVNYERDDKLSNISLTVVGLTNDSNILLEKILKSLSKSATTTTLTPVIITTTKSSNSSEVNTTLDLITYVNKMRQELEDSIAAEKQNIIHELETKFSQISYQTDFPTSPGHERLISNPESSKSMFTETCVGLILAILVCLVLYKFYKSRMFVRRRLSYSTRELPGSMENSNL